MASSSMPPTRPACVHIVGSGPGDPGLITVKGARLLAEADVVLYDDLLDPRLLDLTRPDCERVYAGHRGGRDGGAPTRQTELNERLVAEARAGRRVVRLKGGDPYIFGRGGEEAMALHEAGIPFEIVSGVSAASGVLAYAGIPLTHRHVSLTATLVTGHGAGSGDRDGAGEIDWEALARLGGTLVIFMGSRRLESIAARLVAGGRAAATPAAAVQWGTWPRQRTVVATLETLAERASAEGIESPALIVIGEVVGLRDLLNWFESKPLFGRRLLITRSREQAGPLQMQLESEGATVDTLPLLQISPADDPTPLDAALRRLADMTWVVFTSPNSVTYLFERLRHLGLDSRAFAGVRIAAVGQSTGRLLRERGIEADLVPQTHSAAGLAEAFADVDLRGEQVLLPASSIGRTDLDEALAERGAAVLRVTAYENRPPAAESIELPPSLTEGGLDGVVFASPSGVRHFLDVVGRERGLGWLRDLDIAAIGPTTAAAVTDEGLSVTVQPAESSIPSLVAALCDHYGRR